jgi:anti-sigma28 factor (negative regulator of flagellin synthesis)
MSNTKKISIAISEEIHKQIEDGNYNKNKLVNKLLKEYLQKKQK